MHRILGFPATRPGRKRTQTNFRLSRKRCRKEATVNKINTVQVAQSVKNTSNFIAKAKAFGSVLDGIVHQAPKSGFSIGLFHGKNPKGGQDIFLASTPPSGLITDSVDLPDLGTFVDPLYSDAVRQATMRLAYTDLNVYKDAKTNRPMVEFSTDAELTELGVTTKIAAIAGMIWERSLIGFCVNGTKVSRTLAHYSIALADLQAGKLDRAKKSAYSYADVCNVWRQNRRTDREMSA